MPKTAVITGLAARGFKPKSLTPDQAYIVSSWLGVGYTTLVRNMGLGMGLLQEDQVNALTKVRLPRIRQSLLGFECTEHLVYVDEAWTGRAIDAQVGDVICLPPDVSVEGSVVEEISRDEAICAVKAIEPGKGRCEVPDAGWAQFVRVSRKQYCGLARYRHLEEVDDESAVYSTKPKPTPGLDRGLSQTHGARRQQVAERQHAEFERLGIDLRSLWGQPLQLIDCQNLFCEVDKYGRVYHPEVERGSGRTRIKQKFRSSSACLTYWYPPKWGLNEKINQEQEEDSL